MKNRGVEMHYSMKVVDDLGILLIPSGLQRHYPGTGGG
jgi:hypothetical protein